MQKVVDFGVRVGYGRRMGTDCAGKEVLRAPDGAGTGRRAPSAGATWPTPPQVGSSPGSAPKSSLPGTGIVIYCCLQWIRDFRRQRRRKLGTRPSIDLQINCLDHGCPARDLALELTNRQTGKGRQEAILATALAKDRARVAAADRLFQYFHKHGVSTEILSIVVDEGLVRRRLLGI